MIISMNIKIMILRSARTLRRFKCISTSFVVRMQTAGREAIGLNALEKLKRRVARVEVDTPTKDWSAQVFVADAPAADLAGWGQPVRTVTDVSSSQKIALGDRHGSAVLLWLTNVGQGGKFELSELRVATAG